MALSKPPQDRSNTRNWPATVMRNLAIGRYRKEARKAQLPEGSSADAVKAPTTSRSSDLHEFEHAQQKADAGAARTQRVLSPDPVPALSPGPVEQGVAHELGVPIETVRTRVKRALGRMRENLDQQYDGDRQAWTRGIIATFGIDALKAGPVLGPLAWAGVAALALFGTFAALRWSAANEEQARAIPAAERYAAGEPEEAQLVRPQPPDRSAIAAAASDPDGSQLPGARLMWTPELGSAPLEVTRADVEGQVRFDATRTQGLYYIEHIDPHASAPPFGYRSALLLANSPALGAAGIEPLIVPCYALRRRLRGIVLDAEDRPVPGAQLRLCKLLHPIESSPTFSINPAGLGWIDLDDTGACSRTDGHFELFSRKDDGPRQVSARHGQRSLDHHLPILETTQEITLRLVESPDRLPTPEPASLRGRVSLMDRGASDFELYLVSIRGANLYRIPFSPSEPEFELQDLPPGDYRIVALRAGDPSATLISRLELTPERPTTSAPFRSPRLVGCSSESTPSR